MATMSPHEHAQISYGQQWNALLSKKHNAIKDCVTFKSDCSGRYSTIEQFGTLDLEEKTARHEDKPAVELSTSRVFMFPRSFNQKVKFDEDDGWKLKALGTPMPQSAMRLMQAGERKIEEIMFDGMLGTSVIGNGADEAMINEDLPASQEVAVNFEDGSTNSGLTVEKILEAQRIFMDNDAWGHSSVLDGADALCMAASPKTYIQLWKNAVLTNSDFRSFSGSRPFDTGILQDFLGIKLVVTTANLPKTGDVRTIPMWLKSKVHYGSWNNAETDVWRDRDTGGDRIRFKFTGGACREEAKGVVKIFADESINYSL